MRNCKKEYGRIVVTVGLAAVLSLGLITLTACEDDFDGDDDGTPTPSTWTEDFLIDQSDLASTGRNPYFILEPGYQLVLEGGDEGEFKRLTITVLDETLVVDGVETRIVEERETADGDLVEVSRNYFAISQTHDGVFYFGEDVTMYPDGTHDGSWLAGVDGAEAGLMMSGLPLVGARYYQEMAPDVAMDRAEVILNNLSWDVPAGHFDDVVQTADTTPLEPGVTEYKYYAPGVGLIQDGPLTLVSYGTLNAVMF